MLIVRLCSFLAETELFILLYLAFLIQGFPGGSDGKNKSACNEGDLGSILELGRSLGEWKGYALQYSGLKNSMDCIVHGVAKSRIRLSDFHFHLWLGMSTNQRFLNPTLCLGRLKN